MGVLASTALTHGQMNEPPGARRVRLTVTGRRNTSATARTPTGRFHRQHLPLHARPARKLGAALGARPVPSPRGDGDGRPPGTHHLDPERLDHLGAGDLRGGRRPTPRPRPPSRTSTGLSCSRERSPVGIYPAVESASRILDPPFLGERHYSRERREAHSPALQRLKTSSRSSASTSSRRTTSRCSAARAASCRSRSPSPSSSRAFPAST